MNTQKRAFTLIELLVVIAIIAILAAILFPVFAQAKAAAKKITAVSNCKEIELGSIMYANDYDDQDVPYFSYWNGSTYQSGPPSEYWPGLVSTYIQKAPTGTSGGGGQQILAQDLSKVFFDPIETFTFPTTGAYGNIASWGYSDDFCNWWAPRGVPTTYLAVNGSQVVSPAGTVEFAETWDWLSATGSSDPGYPGSGLLLSAFDQNGPQPFEPAPATNGAVETLQSPYGAANKATGFGLNSHFTPPDPKGQNIVGFADGHVKATNVGYLETTPALWSISGTGQWP